MQVYGLVDFGLSDRLIRAFFRILPLILAAGCASASFKNTWRNWGAIPLEMKKKRVVVMALNMPRTPKLGVEAAATDQLRHMGYLASAAYEIRMAPGTVDSARATLQAAGIEVAMVFRATNDERALYPAGGRYEPPDPYQSYWGWGGGWMESPALVLAGEERVFVETLVYSVRSDQLLWSGVAETRTVSNIGSATRDLVRIAVSDMRNADLLR